MLGARDPATTLSPRGERKRPDYRHVPSPSGSPSGSPSSGDLDQPDSPPPREREREHHGFADFTGTGSLELQSANWWGEEVVTFSTGTGSRIDRLMLDPSYSEGVTTKSFRSDHQVSEGPASFPLLFARLRRLATSALGSRNLTVMFK